mmetsp:Transcript_14272/g.35273  ORF Transcript_14272/g.35273 Transcript_14272/m.35273 type:complete len:220 (+) Transcript_14272:573-1232(+)
MLTRSSAPTNSRQGRQAAARRPHQMPMWSGRPPAPPGRPGLDRRLRWAGGLPARLPLAGREAERSTRGAAPPPALLLPVPGRVGDSGFWASAWLAAAAAPAGVVPPMPAPPPATDTAPVSATDATVLAADSSMTGSARLLRAGRLSAEVSFTPRSPAAPRGDARGDRELAPLTPGTAAAAAAAGGGAASALPDAGTPGDGLPWSDARWPDRPDGEGRSD